ncbi:MAG: replication-relaxation family protein [Patescibacteria group bacterium]
MSVRAAKRSRTVRCKGKHGLEITERDTAILILLGNVRFATPNQISRELFSSLDRCRRRLRQLFDAGYIVITISSSRHPNLVSLTKAGLDVASQAAPHVADRLRLAGAIRLAGIEHHLLCTDIRLFAVALGELRHAPLARWANAGGDLVRELDLARFHIQPDAVAQYTINPSGDAIHIAIEADCATQSVSSVLVGKLRRYAQAAAQTSLDALWLVTSGGEQRRANIDALLNQQGLEQFVRVLSRAHVIARPVRELPARGGSRAVQGPITTSFLDSDSSCTSRCSNTEGRSR